MLGSLSVHLSQKVPEVSDDVAVFDHEFSMYRGTDCWHYVLEILQSLFLLYVGSINSHSTTACQHSSNYLKISSE